MMVPERASDARHEAIVALHRALLAVENNDPHGAENAAQTALAWLREMPRREFSEVDRLKASL